MFRTGSGLVFMRACKSQQQAVAAAPMLQAAVHSAEFLSSKLRIRARYFEAFLCRTLTADQLSLTADCGRNGLPALQEGRRPADAVRLFLRQTRECVEALQIYGRGVFLKVTNSRCAVKSSVWRKRFASVARPLLLPQEVHYMFGPASSLDPGTWHLGTAERHKKKPRIREGAGPGTGPVGSEPSTREQRARRQSSLRGRLFPYDQREFPRDGIGHKCALIASGETRDRHAL
jgi:hypothetical protein